MTVVVRPGQSIQAAIDNAPAGATIDVYAGTYTNQFLAISRNVTLQAVGGMVHLAESKAPPNEKGAILVGTPGLIPGDAPNVTINGFEISGVAIPARLGGNSAAVRWQAGNLTLNDDWFHNNQDGLLGTPAVTGSGDLLINQSEFSDNGSGTGRTHGLYVGLAHSVTITNSFFHDTVAGHEIKSRAEFNTIRGDRIFTDGVDNTGAIGNDSNQIDLPNGGKDVVSNDMIEKGLHSQNPRFLSFGEAQALGGGTDWANSSLTITGNTFINDYGSKAVVLWDPENLSVAASGNKFWDIAPLGGAGNVELPMRPALDFTHPWA